MKTHALDETEVEKDVEDQLKYEEGIVAMRAQMRVMEEENSKAHESEITKPSNLNNAKLPKLSIPTFTGNILQWLEFYELFKINIDDNKTLSNVEKFSYLRSLVKGNAGAVISGFQLSSENYQNALQILTKRFGNQNKILKAHVRELLSVETIKTTKNSVLRNFVDKITVHIRALASLGLANDTYGCFLQQIIMSRLPSFLRLQWARKDPED